MHYNLSPLLSILNENVPSADTWHDRFTSFFANTDYESDLQDWYYDKLVTNVSGVSKLLRNGYFVDPYTGLFSFTSPHIEATHSFNMAMFIERNAQHFYGKKVLTVCADFGMLNIQLKLCGLNLVSSVQKEYFNIGTVLACIGNNSPPYPINKFDFEPEDVLIMSCVFQDDDLAYKNWEYMIDKRQQGREVFFTSNSYVFLRKYMNYDKIELVIDPKSVYNSESYSDISYGYMNRIYRLK